MNSNKTNKRIKLQSWAKRKVKNAITKLNEMDEKQAIARYEAHCYRKENRSEVLKINLIMVAIILLGFAGFYYFFGDSKDVKPKTNNKPAITQLENQEKGSSYTKKKQSISTKELLIKTSSMPIV